MVQCRSSGVAQWCSGAVAQWRSSGVARTSDSRLRESEFKLCCLWTLFKFIHSTLLQFTQLYERLTGCGGYSSTNNLGLRLPREVEMVFD